VFVDLRKDSKTYGAWDAIELTEDNDRAVYISKGFAHGFKTLAANTVVEYKIDTSYDPGSTTGIFWNDPDIGIEWNEEDPIVSQRDGELKSFSEFDSPFLSEPPA